MSVIHTKRNMVAAYEPLPEDLFVEVRIGTPSGRRVLLTKKIAEYETAVTWAREMADVMEHHIEVVPVTGPEYMHRNRSSIAHFMATLTDQEHGEVRSILVTAMGDLMRDSDDPEIRREAHGVLRQLRAIE
ncbi:hypothetical protein EF888_02300 [Silicimonas algicola]|uniref:Uncharacterized protein n=1 Tax=Silicimonas algicola TaxID=1826607 RepID=A0A316GCS9_9RHOB|nr:hypothetical protein [Silicimonas algicola]AZQ66056.1 hypothetical protein EF888_02300 [Silicimonas algicola]PWK58353.1 hypothetical protein C8D95_101166 [Silicimonas algicola]